jgi:hypothetical protein
MDYTLKRWETLTRFLDDGQLLIDKNWIENTISHIAKGRSNWLFAGSLSAGKRSAAIKSLIQSEKNEWTRSISLLKRHPRAATHT